MWNRASAINKSLLGLLAGCLLTGMALANPYAAAREGMDAESQQFREYQVKALFLYNFANFVEWPEEAFADEESPLRLCLFGEVPFGIFLDVVDGTVIRKRRLDVIQSNVLKDIEEGCHVLFVGNDQRHHLPQFFQEIKYVYVLSVGDTENFTDAGGIISILRTTDQVEFEINLSQALENGLFISSDLLSLARVIKKHTQLKE